MFSILFALFSTLLYVSVTTAQSCGLRYHSASIYPYYRPWYYITSPNYPLNYPSSTTCEWTITAPFGYVVELSFVTFNTEGYYSSGSCSSSSDILEVYDGSYRSSSKLRGKYCKDYLPANVYSSGTSLYLRFSSDSYAEKKGFEIKFKAVKPKPDSTICSPFNTFSQNNNIQLSGSSGYIESPLYGSKYPSNMQCTWVITVPEGKKIKLTFSDFVVGGSLYSCSAYHYSTYDNIQIKDGRYSNSNSLKTLCGHTLPSAVSSSGRYMWIRFKSNSNNYNTRSSTGFKAKYEEKFISSSTSDSDSIDIDPLPILLIVCVCISLLCICTYLACRKRTSHHDNVQDPGVAQTTITNRQTPSASSYPTVHYSPAPQSSYPPSSSGYPPPTQDSNQQPPPAGSYPMSTTGGAGDITQPSAPTRDHSSGTFLNDPPPTYPEAVPDVSPPPYPGIVSQNPSQAQVMNMTTPV